MRYSIEQIKHIHRSDCLNFETFDKEYNVDTASPIIPADDNEDEMRPWWIDNSDVVSGSEGYQPIPLYWLDMMIKYFSKNDSDKLTFVDVGSGKGKAILYSILKNAPFKSYIGIEADQHYVEIFNNNLKTTNININKPVLSILMDAMDFDYSINDRVYFFFQPFSFELFNKFIHKHKDVLKATNSYAVFVISEDYNVINVMEIMPVYKEGLLSIYKFGEQQ